MSITPYLDLITSEHRNKPNFIALTSAYLQKVDDIGTCADAVNDAFSVDTSVGVQEDVVGQLVGAQRDIGVQLTSGSSVLDDTHFRTLIRATIAKNQWDGTTPGIYSLWSTIFPDSQLQIIDNQDMTIQGVVTGMTDTISQELVNNGLIVPQPMGVQLTLIEQTNVSQTQYTGFTIGGGYDVVHLTTMMP